MVVRRPALRYFGGKFRIAPWIISHFPEHVCYVEPFGGAASVLLRKKPSEIEVLNDVDGEVINYFKVLRDRPNELIRAINLTPYARGEYELAYREEQNISDLERARRLYARSYMTIGGPRAQWRSGWRFERNLKRGKKTVSEFIDIVHLFGIAKRLKLVQIECDDAFDVIKRFDTSETLFYLDPPYLARTRSERWNNKAYHYELSDEDHVRLSELINEVKGMVVISGYLSELYRELYKGWKVFGRKSRIMAQKRRMEYLWISPNVMKRKRQMVLL